MDANYQQSQQQQQPVAQQPAGQQVPTPYQPQAATLNPHQEQPQAPQNVPASYPPPAQQAQGPVQPSPAQPSSDVPTKAKEFDIKDFHKYITKQVALGIAGVMLLFSVIGVITSINDISTVSSAIDSVFPFRTSFADNSPFSAAASSVRAELERLRIYLFINLAANLLQALVSGAGLLAILKNLPATHKLYLYGSGALVVLRVVLLFLLRVNGLSIFTMLLNAAILYAIWVYQGKIEASVADAPKEPTPNESTEMTA